MELQGTMLHNVSLSNEIVAALTLAIANDKTIFDEMPRYCLMLSWYELFVLLSILELVYRRGLNLAKLSS